jgi:multidrug transporter EmrE-like cation transporter
VSNVSLAVAVGLVCALLSALGTNLAFLFKHRGALAAPDVEMRHPLRSAVGLFRSRWWSIGWGVAAVAFALHVAALTLAPISVGQAVLAGGLVFLAVLAERFFGFELGQRQWTGIGLIAVSLTALTLTGGIRADPRRGGVDPGARSRWRRARGVGHGAREPTTSTGRARLPERSQGSLTVTLRVRVFLAGVRG